VAGYRIRIKRSAAKEIERIEPVSLRRKVIERIRSLAADPRPRGCEKLSGKLERYRVRQGQYRVLYSVDDDILRVYVVKVGDRREVYRVR